MQKMNTDHIKRYRKKWKLIFFAFICINEFTIVSFLLILNLSVYSNLSRF